MKISKLKIGDDFPCYIIAEISHNHQGKESEAMAIINAAAKNGANAVKFQKRDNENLFLADFYSKEYQNVNSFGKTYGEHRTFLEPKISWLKKANVLAHRLKLDFIMTVFDEASLSICEKELNIDAYKIQSSDLTNHLLIKKVALTKKPYFISCGASTLAEIKKSFSFCKSLNTPFCMMYAVSEYPTADKHVNLKRITQLKNIFKTTLWGFSCHHQTIQPAIYSRILGVVAIEKHFTLNKSQKGPDHKLSITPMELYSLRQELDRVDLFSGLNWIKNTSVESYQLDAKYKMGKCAIANKNLKKGEILKQTDIVYKSPMKGLGYIESQKIIGKPLKKNFLKGEVIS